MTEADLRAAGIIPIFCPCCNVDMTNTYNRGHRHDCKLKKFLAQMALWERAKELATR